MKSSVPAANKFIIENVVYVDLEKVKEFIVEIFFNMLIKNTTHIVKLNREIAKTRKIILVQYKLIKLLVMH